MSLDAGAAPGPKDSYVLVREMGLWYVHSCGCLGENPTNTIYDG